MSRLSDLSDRLTRNSRAIKSSAISIQNAKSGKFVRAVLDTELGNLIREIEPSETGLLRIEREPTAATPHEKDTQHASAGVQISRVEFHGATPLRKPATRKEEKTKEIQPEAYAKAALKYIDKYYDVHPMPAAEARVQDLLDAIDEVRNHMQELSETLRQTEVAEAPSVQAIADEEEKRVEELKEQIAECLKRREILTARKARMKLPSPSKKLAMESARRPAPSKGDSAEDEFWNTPSNKGRTFVLNDSLLMDQEVDFGDMSVASFASPVRAPRSRFASELEDEADRDSSSTPPDSPTQRIKIPSRSLTPTQEGSPSPKEPETLIQEPRSLPDDPPQVEIGNPKPEKEPKPQISMETERIVAKMWATVGDIIMPGNVFSSVPGKEKPPEAKMTLAHLRYVSSLTPVPASPMQSVSSLSSAARANAPPTPQQILTATLLFSLVTAPGHSLPLNKVKEALTAKASTSGSAAMVSSHSRILYGCVAKRLLKIDRGSGEQIVRFDI